MIFDVAFALETRGDAIQNLDVLSEEDARTLLLSKVSDLEDVIADQVARGLGYHAQALTLHWPLGL